jgi:Aromatic-ring-opening dioxygenase LigAB, LigA subunit
MSVYTVHKLLHRAQVDLDFRERLRTEPADVLAELSFTDEERSALLAGDVVTLARAGVHTFLLSRIPRFQLFGLDRDEYIRRMRSAE